MPNAKCHFMAVECRFSHAKVPFQRGQRASFLMPCRVFGGVGCCKPCRGMSPWLWPIVSWQMSYSSRIYILIHKKQCATYIFFINNITFASKFFYMTCSPDVLPHEEKGRLRRGRGLSERQGFFRRLHTHIKDTHTNIIHLWEAFSEQFPRKAA